MQMLVFVVLAASWGIYSLFKKKPENSKGRRKNFVDNSRRRPTKIHLAFQSLHQHLTPRNGITQKYQTKKQSIEPHTPRPTEEATFDTSERLRKVDGLAKEKGGDLNSGMELLDLNFLLNTVENSKDDEENNVTVRKLAFNELLRRKKQNQIDSKALGVYVVNQGNLYDKSIQSEAMKELAKRTAYKKKETETPHYIFS